MIQDVLAAGSHLQLLELLSLCSHYLIQVCELSPCSYLLHVSCPGSHNMYPHQLERSENMGPALVEFLQDTSREAPKE